MGDDVFSLVFPFSLTDDELLMFDLQSLATLATARALEMGPQDGSGTASCQNFPPRRVLNLRRKCTWTPRNEPVSTKYAREAWHLANCKEFLNLWFFEFRQLSANNVHLRYAQPKVP